MSALLGMEDELAEWLQCDHVSVLRFCVVATWLRLQEVRVERNAKGESNDDREE
jgi:hypothetical protein